MRVLGQHEAADALTQRDVERAGPARRLLDREPDNVEVVALVFGFEPTEPGHRRVPSIGADHHVGADLERLFAMHVLTRTVVMASRGRRLDAT
jgi:hypothetical protein